MNQALTLWVPAAEEGQAVRRRTSTPVLLRRLATLVGVGCTFLALAGTAAVALTQSAVDSVGGRTVPAIVDAQKLHEGLADADRLAANDFLSGGIEVGGPRQQYLQDIDAVTAQLERAAERNTVGSQVSSDLQRVSRKVTEYASLVETARAYNRVGYPIGATYLRTASRLMHDPKTGILADVDTLDRLNNQDLGRENTQVWIAAGTLACFYVAGLVLLGILVYTQGFLRIRFRRRRTPRVLAATALLVMLGAGLGAQATFTYVNLEQAQLKAFDRLHGLWQIRSLAVDANGNESLSLIARGSGTTFDDAFKAETKQLVDRPLTNQLVQAATTGDVRFKGLLADEIVNASFPGEREAAVKALQAYQQFLQIDQAVRDKSSSDREGAVALALGSGPGQLGSAFAEMDTSLGNAIGIVRDRYDTAVSMARPSLALDAAVPLCALAIAALAIWGLRPRLAEYTV